MGGYELARRRIILRRRAVYRKCWKQQYRLYGTFKLEIIGDKDTLASVILWALMLFAPPAGNLDIVGDRKVLY